MFESSHARRSSSLFKVKFLSLAFTALNLLPSIEINDFDKIFSLRQYRLNSLKTDSIHWMLSLRKSESVLKSGVSLPVSHISSTLHLHSLASLRDERTP